MLPRTPVVSKRMTCRRRSTGRCCAASTRLTSCHTGSTRPLTRYSVWMRAPAPCRRCAALS